MPALAVPVFALSAWLACYLLGRDPGRTVLRWASSALWAYAIGVLIWTLAPGSVFAQVWLCLPALGWAGAVVALLPLTPRERRPVDRGALVLGLLFLAMVIALPPIGRLVALAPLAGALTLLWRLRAQVLPLRLPLAMTTMAGLYAAGLVLLLVPVKGADVAALAALGVDLLAAGYLIAVAHAVETGERLRPDLRRSATGAIVVTVLAGVPATVTMMLTPGDDVVAVLQFLIIAVAMAGVGLSGRVRRLLDRVALGDEGPLRTDRAALFSNADALLRRRERRRLDSIGEPEFLRLTRRALSDFGDLDRLTRSPLTDLPVVERRLAGREDQPRARARELRAVLRECVSGLRPTGPFGTTDEWRYYNVLQFCCVLGIDPYARRPRTDGMSREARLAVDWFKRYVPRDVTRQWQQEAAMIVAGGLWDELSGRHLHETTTRSG
ncbi:hypothetical protein FB565_001774 [Actinoplanes lutulentus]|uniref:Transmembrane protein n=1 Tax=Actinoplanes lutulentus TaxID=1287878 RepID=A0A327Z0G3_9ACTN|nr:hypothetical protein [Actinoplanes lutulentus]MBB2942061.1 hypothetical protein [Actinoplanes lutulentus]RAK26985.1 hypothetical protein B0I29_125142 [Actinoplanes lutulentus]